MTGKDILVVEDENIVALDMRMRLESMGYRVVDVVDTGELAMERVVSTSPDLVLMDIKLKGGSDGIETARRLRELRELPVIFVTAFTDERTLERAKLTSPYGYIVKPFHERELRIAIELALYKHQYELSMRQAKELAEETSRAKGEFLANMSHELKTPLNSIIGFTQLALDRASDDEQREYLGMAVGSAKSLLTLIESVLDFARMEGGRLAAVCVPFSLDLVLGDCVDALSVGAYTRGLEARFRRDPSIPDILVGDGNMLRHVLLNLLDNAAKFTDSGHVALAAESCGSLDGVAGGRLLVEFSVTDTGMGMPPDKIESAFERFTQLDGSRTRRAGGTGLGLAIVQKTVELMGGTIVVKSEQGAGTRIALRIPFGTEDEAERRPPALLGRSVLLAGIMPESAAEAAETVTSLGASFRIAAEPWGALPDELVVVDEKALPRSDPRTERLRGRLVVATRFGSSARTLLEAGGGVAFVPLPLRAGRLAAAAVSLDQDRGAAPRSGSPREGGAWAAPPRDGLDAFAEAIEASLASGRWDSAERECRELRERLAREGDEEWQRLAFAGLLMARRGDGEGLRGLAARARGRALHASGKGER